MAAGRTAPLKSFLLDQARVAGVGNIYADEALFRARLHPLSPAGSMKPEHLEALRDGVVAALEAGLDGGGASIDDYRDARGEQGTMQDEFLVHTREGEPCPRCGGTIVRIVVGGRSTYYCPSCQVRLAQAAETASAPSVRRRSDGSWPERRSRPRRSSCAASATARPTASSISTRRRAGGSARSPRARGGRSRASAAGWSRSSGSTSCCTKGRGELMTVTSVATVDGYPRLRSSGAGAQRRRPRLRRGAAAARLGRAQPARLQPALPLPRAARRPRRGARRRGLETALSFRLKLALAAGFAPELASCARCGEAEHLAGFSGAAGGVVCASCEAGSFPLSEEAHRFMVEALAQAAGRGARTAEPRRCAKPSGRSARRSSTTRTCSSGPLHKSGR